MAESIDAESILSSAEQLGEGLADGVQALSENWGWLMALGILFIILGSIGLGMPYIYTLTTVTLFGILFLVAGGFQLVDAFQRKGWQSVTLYILLALLYLAAGMALMTNPMAGSMALTAMLSGIFIAIGILRIVMAFQLKSAGVSWGWIMFAGVMAILLGGMIIAGWPDSSIWVIGMLVAIEMIFAGWAYIMLALSVKPEKEASSS